MTLTYYFTETDLYEVNLYAFWSAPERIGYRLRTMLIPCVVLVLLCTYEVWSDGILYKPTSIKGLLLFAALSLAMCLFIIPKLVQLNIRRQSMISVSRERYLGRKQLEVDDSGLTFKEVDDVAHYDWSTITKVNATKHYLFIYISSNAILPIRNDAVTPRERLAEIELILKRKLGTSFTSLDL